MTIPRPNSSDSTTGGIVELGTPTLGALETITAVGPLTDEQLRADPPSVLNVGQLVPAEFDAIDLSPPDKPTTIRYYVGGVGGTLVATLSLTYSGDDVATVSRV